MPAQPRKIWWVAGVGTGAGKTIWAALLIRCARSIGLAALGMKPISSGGRDDARILRRAQGGRERLDAINPLHFAQPIAPAIAAAQRGVSIELASVAEAIWRRASRCELLVVEGAGGIMSPLGRNFTLLELLRVFGGEENGGLAGTIPGSRSRGSVAQKLFLVAPNRLGVINETLLSVCALQTRAAQPAPEIVLVEQARPDCSAKSNRAFLEKALGRRVISAPHLGANPFKNRIGTRAEKKLRKLLASWL